MPLPPRGGDARTHAFQPHQLMGGVSLKPTSRKCVPLSKALPPWLAWEMGISGAGSPALETLNVSRGSRGSQRAPQYTRSCPHVMWSGHAGELSHGII